MEKKNKKLEKLRKTPRKELLELREKSKGNDKVLVNYILTE